MGEKKEKKPLKSFVAIEKAPVAIIMVKEAGSSRAIDLSRSDFMKGKL